MPPSLQTPTNTHAEVGNASGYTLPLVYLTVLFFMWGFITCLNDILIPHLKRLFDLSYAQAMLVQFCFFGAYFLVSLPAGSVVKRLGYRRGIILGLIISGCGALMFLPAARLTQYPLFLAALFTLATGITFLQVAANPYVTRLGPARTASSRLNLTQAFNSLGTTLAPFFGAFLILSVTDIGMGASRMDQARAVELPYLVLAGALFVLALVFAFLNLPAIDEEAEVPSNDIVESGNIRACHHLFFGAGAIFLYVGAEVAIGSLLVNFISLPTITGLPEAAAATYVSFYWGGAMVGRFIGAVLMRRISAGRVLVFNGIAAVLFLLVTVFSAGKLAMWAVLLVGLCNSIMFPTIFSLALYRLGPLTSQGSSILCLAIVGGALVPLVQGLAADTFGLQQAFLLPIACYLYIAWFGARSVRLMDNP